MSVTVANWVVGIAGVYLALGIVFSVPFLVRGLRRVDPATAGGTVGFKLVILPGVVALWPLLARRWLSGQTSPPEERNAHRTG
jgi:hypothetical protein